MVNFQLLIVFIVLVLVSAIITEKKIRRRYNLKKSGQYPKFANKAHMVASYSVMIIVIASSIYLGYFRFTVMLMVVAGCIADTFFELKYRREEKLYVVNMVWLIAMVLVFLLIFTMLPVTFYTRQYLYR
jgi:hypothetical protein